LLGEDIYKRNPPEAALRGELQTFERTIPRPDFGSGVRYSQSTTRRTSPMVKSFGYVLVYDITEITENWLSLLSMKPRAVDVPLLRQPMPAIWEGYCNRAE
jgi:hypothetical protein